MTILRTLAWIIGAIVTLKTFSIIVGAQLSRIGKAIFCGIVLAAIAAFVLPEKAPLLIIGELALLNAGVRPLKKREPSIPFSLAALVASVCAVVVAGICFSGGGIKYSGDIVADVQSNVAKRWEDIVTKCDVVVKDYATYFKSGEKQGSTEYVPKSLSAVRELLLPVNSHEVLAAVDELDKRIAETQEELIGAEGERVRHPDEAEKYDARITAVREKKAKLEVERANQVAKVLEELRGLDLELPNGTAERCLFPVNVESIIDIAIVAKDISVIVGHLERFLNSEDLSTLKRYFGMYLVLIDVQAESFRQYLEKSRKGEWRNGINEIRDRAKAAAESDTANAMQDRFSEHERKIFSANAETNKKTVRAAEVYLGLLKEHEDIISKKLVEVERIRVVAQSSLNTVSLASDLREIAKTSHDAFKALLSLKLPQLMPTFKDDALLAEFDAITRKLREE